MYLMKLFLLIKSKYMNMLQISKLLSNYLYVIIIITRKHSIINSKCINAI